MRLGRVRADVQRALAVLHVVVRIGHGAVAPGVGHARHCGRVADARLVVAVVAAPKTHPLAQQVRLLVVVLGRADHVDRVRPALFAQRQHALSDFVERGVPADALVFAVHQLHRIAQPVFAMAVLAQCGALGAVRAQVDGRVKHRLLAHPDAVFNHCIDRAADRAVRAHRAPDDDVGSLAGSIWRGCLGLFHQRQLRGRQTHADSQPRASQKGTPVHGGQRMRQATREAFRKARRVKTLAVLERRAGRFFREQHAALREK